MVETDGIPTLNGRNEVGVRPNIFVQQHSDSVQFLGSFLVSELINRALTWTIRTLSANIDRESRWREALTFSG